MSAADVGIGEPSAPRQDATLVARTREIAARLWAKASRLLAQDEGALAAWVAALAAAPQIVPNLPRPPNKRLTGFVVGFVLGAHLVLLAVLYWRSTPPPSPEAEMTVELVHDMPEAAKPKPPEAKPAPKAPERPVQEGSSAEHKQTTQEQGKQQQSTKSEQHQAKPEQKPAEPKQEQKSEAKAQPKAETPKPAHREAHRAPPNSEQKEQAQQKALEAKIQELQKAQEELKQEREQQQQEQQQQQALEQQRELQQKQALASQAPRGPGLDMPAIALPGTSDAGTETVSYPQLVLSQVAKAKKEGRYMGVPGYAGVRFRVAEDGSVEMVKLVSSSGDPNLDIEAEAMIRRAAPFPKPPAGARRDYGITLVFKPQS